MFHMRTTPARWPALLFLTLALAVLPACGTLQGAPGADPSEPQAERDAFTLDIQAEDDAIRDYLGRHLELQRFRQLPDLQSQELARLLQVADANARELLATLGYFSPEITLQLQDKPTPAKDEPAQTVRLAVQPGPRTQVESVDIAIAHADTPDLKRRQAQLQRNWGLPEGAPFTQQAWDEAKAQ
ncbi:MAG: outer membrane protein assembly factor, partial [Alicycliphilus sp.]|nr:outer membrane protein assembly factor [Alicycliphilus sp.]